MYLFSLASILLNCLVEKSPTPFYQNWKFVLMGNIRNTFFASGLWFLSCLFIIKILFTIIRCIFKNIWQIFLTCSVLAAITSITVKPTLTPHWIYNIDSALFYILYFALGYITPNIEKKWHELKFTYKGVMKYCIFILLLAYSIALYFGIDTPNILYANSFTATCYSLVKPMLLIIPITLISKTIPRISFIQSIGQNTLYLCGTEYIIKTIFPLLLEYFGVTLLLPTPSLTFVYTFFLLILCNYTAVPIMKFIFKL